MAEDNSKGGYGWLVAVLLLLLPGSWALQLRSGAAKPAAAVRDSSEKGGEKAVDRNDAAPPRAPSETQVSHVKKLLIEYCSGDPVPNKSAANGDANADANADANTNADANANANANVNTSAATGNAKAAGSVATGAAESPLAASPPDPSSSKAMKPTQGPWPAGDPTDARVRSPWATRTSFCRSQDGGFAVQASVALVPEKGWGLDGAVESLIRAHETAGYVLVRFHLPERSDDRKESGTRATWLGGLLFHRQPSAALAQAVAGPRCLADVQLVYLVLESPTDGVDAAALQWALAERSELPPGPEPVLRILGPTFSGSARRLGWLLGQLTQKFASLSSLDLTVVSGTATGQSLVAQLCAGWHIVRADAACSDGPKGQQGTQPQLTVHSMVRSDPAMKASLWRYLRGELHAVPQQIAIVSESSTVYGQQTLASRNPGTQCNAPQYAGQARVQAMTSAWQPGQDCDPCSPTDATGPDPATTASQEPFAGAMLLPMPSGLAHLRAEWAKQGRADSTASSKGAPARALDPIATDAGRRDGLRLYERSTLNYRDLSLAALLTSICQEGIRYVGLFLTDPADKEFLAQRIALQCPDVRLFTMESELDYLHVKHYSYMRGALVASTYPLYSRNTQWSVHYNANDTDGRSLRRLQFARQADQGLYNAALYSIGRSDLMQEYAPPRFVPKSQRGDTWTRPPVWISAVGREGLLPLRAYGDQPSSPADQAGAAAAPKDEEANPPWVPDRWQKPGKYAPYDLGTVRFALLLMAILAFMHSWAFFRNQYGRPTLVSLPHERSRFFDFMVPWTAPGATVPSRPSVHYLFLFAPIWAALTFLTLVLALRFRAQNVAGSVLSKSFWEDLGYSLTGVVAMTSMVLALADVVMRRFTQDPLLSLWRRLASRIARSLPVTLLSLLAPSLLVGAGIFAFNSRIAYLPGWVLFLRRSSQTDYELSLLVPTVFLALVGYGWGLSSLRRQHYFDRRQPVTPAGMAPPGAEGAPTGRPAWQLSSPVWLAILVGTTVAMIPILRRLSTIDHWALDVAFALSLWAVAVAVIGSLVRVASTWHRLRQQIFWTTHHPIAGPLKTLPPALMDPLRSLLTTTLSAYTEQALIAKQCQRVDQAYADMTDAERQAWASHLPTGAEPPWRRMQASVSPVAAPAQNQTVRQAETGASRRQNDPPLTPDHQLAKLLVAVGVWPSGNTPVLAASDAERAGAAEEATGAQRFHRRVQELLALRLVVYLFHLVTPLRETMLFVSASLILTLLALNSYPFQPAQSLGTFTWLLMLAGVALLGVVLLQMRRDPILSGLAAGDTGKLNWDTGLGKQFSLVILAPILTMLATKVPSLSWLASLLPSSGN